MYSCYEEGFIGVSMLYSNIDNKIIKHPEYSENTLLIIMGLSMDPRFREVVYWSENSGTPC